MLTRSLKLNKNKRMVTPGVNLPFYDFALTDGYAAENMEEYVVVATAMVCAKFVHFN